MGSVACPSCGAQVSQDGINSEEVPSGVPSGEMLPAASSQSQPIFDKAQTVETSRINGVAESAQGDVDPQDPWSDSRAVNITNNPEFINGKKRPAPASVSMSSLRPGMIEMGRGDMIRKVFPGAPIPQRGVIPHVSKGIAQGVRNRLKAKKLLEGKILPPAGYMPDGRRLF